MIKLWAQHGKENQKNEDGQHGRVKSTKPRQVT